MPREKIWHVGTLNVQAGLSTHSYRDYVTKSWHHISPTSQSKQKNLISVGDCVQHLDVFGAQEVDPGSLRSGFSNQASYLASHAGFEHMAFQANRRTGFSTTANALFAKHPLNAVHQVCLPSRKATTSPRGLLMSCVETAKGPVCFAVAHLSLHPLDREKQSQEIVSVLNNHDRVVLMGDFNDTPQSLSLKSLTHVFDGVTSSPTYPRWKPTKNIDLIWWRGVDVVDEGCHPWGATDHCGVDIRFKIK